MVVWNSMFLRRSRLRRHLRHQRDHVHSHVRFILCWRSKSFETRRGSNLASHCHGKTDEKWGCNYFRLREVEIIYTCDASVILGNVLPNFVFNCAFTSATSSRKHIKRSWFHYFFKHSRNSTKTWRSVFVTSRTEFIFGLKIPYDLLFVTKAGKKICYIVLNRNQFC